MNGKESFDAIMTTITGGLTGNVAEDIAYLQKQMEKYKEHEYGKEILRACGRLIYRITPEETKEKLNSLLNKESLGIKEAMEEARFNVYKKNYDKALKILTDIVDRFEKSGVFKDDKVTEYHSFANPLEFIIFANVYKPEKQAKDMGPNIYQMYHELGSLLFEVKRYDEAEKALEKALTWNPVSAGAAFEYAEISKVRGDLDKFFAVTKGCFDFISEPEDLGRAYRNLGYYFVEKELYYVAAACNYLSLQYDNESKVAQSELYYIQQVTGETMDFPAMEELEEYSEEYGFPIGPSHEVVGIAYHCGKQALDEGHANIARFFLQKVYDLIPAEEIKELLDSIPTDE